MKRRDFLKKCLLTGAAASLGSLNSIAAKSNLSPEEIDIVAIKNGSPGDMFSKGIAALGGITRFVKKGQTVVIKPNMSWAYKPETGANTNPELVAEIIKQCKSAGASKVYVMDHILNLNSEKISGILQASESAGAILSPSSELKYYKEVNIPGAKTLKTAEVHNLIIDADVFINVPVLKSHGGAKMTAAMKNLMGVVWDRQFYHRKGLDQCIADFPLYRKPTLNIVDAYRVLVNNGPRYKPGSKIITPKMQFISTDIVAIDAICLAQSKAWGLVRGNVPYVEMAYDNHLGKMDISKLNIKKISA